MKNILIKVYMMGMHKFEYNVISYFGNVVIIYI